jgi:L-ribulose-5-phosphate 3-epimerase
MNRRHLLKTLPLAAASFPGMAAGAPTRARLRSALCAYSYRDALSKKTMTHDDLVRIAVENNVEGIDLTVYWFPDTSDAFLMPLRRVAYKNAVEIYSIAVRTVMTQPTPELRDKELIEVRKWVDVAAKLGAGHVRVFGGEVPKGKTEDEAAPWVVEVLKRGAEYASSKGVILGLENHGGITERAARIVDIVKKVDSPWVGINLDTGNFKSDVFRQMEACLPYAANVQVKAEMLDDAGNLVRQDWDKVVRLIAAGGYRGYLSLEYEAKEQADTAVPRLLGELNAVIRKYSA